TVLHPMTPFSPTTMISITVVMILRVYVMWGQSKRILWVLLFIYMLQVVVTFVFPAIYDNPDTYLSGMSQTKLQVSLQSHASGPSLTFFCPVTITQVIDLSFCNSSLNTSSLINVYGVLPRLVLSATLLVLAVIQTLKQSVEMYKTTKKWQLNQYMQQLVRDGIIYFLMNMLLNSNAFLILLTGATSTISSTSMLFLNMFCVITLCPMMPRFIISVRELHQRDPRRRCQGIDSGFGVLLQPIARDNAAVSAIALADVAPGQGQMVEGGADESEAIQLE
ncbi:hypothetical protein J3R83DRAFT_10369, partial [Lanmaoa asiatica]